MEAWRHISEKDMHRRPHQEKKRYSAVVYSAQFTDETGILESQGYRYPVYDLVEELSSTQPQVDDNSTVDEHTAGQGLQGDAHFKLIVLSQSMREHHYMGLDQDSLVKISQYLDLDTWLLRRAWRTSGWICHTFSEGILNFQVLTKMYYIAWSVNTTLQPAKTKAILIPQGHIGHSRWFTDRGILELLLKAHLIGVEGPFGLANLVLLDVISYMELQLSDPWDVGTGSEIIGGHGMVGHNHNVGISDLDTSRLARAARSLRRSVGSVRTCIRLAELVERMVTDLQDEVDKLCTAQKDGWETPVHTSRWTDHSSVIKSLEFHKKSIRNFKADATDLDNRVIAQSATILSLIANRHEEATGPDTSSGLMRTIAIMTMVFLPEIFFAALFAVPSLDWSGPKVITNNFWVYWAFTLPFALVVFIIWYMLSIDRPLERLTRRARASQDTLWSA